MGKFGDRIPGRCLATWRQRWGDASPSQGIPRTRAALGARQTPGPRLSLCADGRPGVGIGDTASRKEGLPGLQKSQM